MPYKSGIFITDNQDHVLSMFLSESIISIDENEPGLLTIRSDTNMNAFNVADNCSQDTTDFQSCILKQSTTSKQFNGVYLYLYIQDQPLVKHDLVGGYLKIVSQQEIAVEFGVAVSNAEPVIPIATHVSPEDTEAVSNAEPVIPIATHVNPENTESIHATESPNNITKNTNTYVPQNMTKNINTYIPQDVTKNINTYASQDKTDETGEATKSLDPILDGQSTELKGDDIVVQSPNEYAIIYEAFEEGFKIGEMVKIKAIPTK
jgi:hypothetical protein